MNNQEITKSTYERADLVEEFENSHLEPSKDMQDQMKEISGIVSGNKVIDIGCGPGQDSYFWKSLGFDVTGVDYSSEMIKHAINKGDGSDNPHFEILDMRDLSKRFSENEFDVAWVSASLIHIPEKDVSQVLCSIKSIVKNQGIIFITLKKGEQGPKLVKEDKYLKGIEREFIFWQKKNFQNLVKSLGLIVKNTSESAKGLTAGQITQWLSFILEVVK